MCLFCFSNKYWPSYKITTLVNKHIILINFAGWPISFIFYQKAVLIGTGLNNQSQNTAFSFTHILIFILTHSYSHFGSYSKFGKPFTYIKIPHSFPFRTLSTSGSLRRSHFDWNLKSYNVLENDNKKDEDAGKINVLGSEFTKLFKTGKQGLAMEN